MVKNFASEKSRLFQLVDTLGDDLQCALLSYLAHKQFLNETKSDIELRKGRSKKAFAFLVCAERFEELLFAEDNVPREAAIVRMLEQCGPSPTFRRKRCNRSRL